MSTPLLEEKEESGPHHSGERDIFIKDAGALRSSSKERDRAKQPKPNPPVVRGGGNPAHKAPAGGKGALRLNRGEEGAEDKSSYRLLCSRSQRRREGKYAAADVRKGKDLARPAQGGEEKGCNLKKGHRVFNREESIPETLNGATIAPRGSTSGPIACKKKRSHHREGGDPSYFVSAGKKKFRPRQGRADAWRIVRPDGLWGAGAWKGAL